MWGQNIELLHIKYLAFKIFYSSVKVFKELAYKISPHEEHILNTIEKELSSARCESITKSNCLFIKPTALEISKICRI